MRLKDLIRLALLVIVLVLQEVKCESQGSASSLLQSDSVKGLAEAQHSHLREHEHTSKRQSHLPHETDYKADTEVGGIQASQSEGNSVPEAAKPPEPLAPTNEKSPASHSIPDTPPDGDEDDTADEEGEPKNPVSRSDQEQELKKAVEASANELGVAVADEDLIPREHVGSHDGHHPVAGVDKGRQHDLKAFHPGLEKRMGPVESEDEDDESVQDRERQASDREYSSGNNLPIQIKQEDPLPASGNKPEQTVDEDSFTHDKVHEKPQGKDKESEDKGEEENAQPFTLFTIANTDIGTDYVRLPYREKYQWQDRNAPCHSFQLKVPDELVEKSIITLCIFRPSLEFTDETKQFIVNFEPSDEKNAPQKVFGYVMNTQESTVYGKVVDRYFYGEVSILDKNTNQVNIYVAEEILLLNRLMRNNMKTLRNMLMVMHNAGSSEAAKDNNKPVVYNAVVTKGASLINFMMYTNPNDVNRNPFLMFSTNHNSYICAGEPYIKVDGDGQVRLESGSNKIQVENDGSVKLTTASKEYTFRPNGRTIVREGMAVKTLQEHEGSVAVTAYSSQQTYDCVLPTPAFQTKRKGGYVCKICLALDDLFIQHYLVLRVKENEMAQDYMARIIDRVSWIFRSKDFDGDKRPDNIGVDFDAQPAHWSYPNVGNEALDEQSSEILFQSLEQFEFADCCLGIGYTMKQLPDNALGKRPTSKQNGPSGICSGRTGRIANNLIIISANNHRGNFSAISEDQLIYLTANQIAGAFGANPDGSGDDVCDQFIDEKKKTRHFLMWPDVLRNTSLSEQRLSTCSKSDIVKTLSTCKSSCFDIDKHPFCGNGVVEEGEECDCGSEQNCQLQTCCYSRIGKHPCRKSGIGCKSGAVSLLLSGLSFGTIITMLLPIMGRYLL